MPTMKLNELGASQDEALIRMNSAFMAIINTYDLATKMAYDILAERTMPIDKGFYYNETK